MNKILKRITAVAAMLVITSVTSLSGVNPKAFEEPKVSAAENETPGTGNKYISQVKIGMGETSNEAKKELEAEGYIILKDESGNFADLNAGAGSKSALKRGANDKIVYLGYKTTFNINDAITDMAVMNMNGGYSIEDYNKLIDQQKDSQIIPFVDRFKETLKEYRANYKMGKKTKNYIRANYMRKLLNKMTDDDTGGKPMGDLLLNETKYEMGDEAYNKLSDAEKKNHADILTLLMQANGKATLAIQTLLTKASDSSKTDTWVERFCSTSIDDLKTQVKKENKALTTKEDVNAALDKKYNDTAKDLLKKWKSFQKEVLDYEDKADDLNADVDEDLESIDDVKDIDLIKASDDEIDEYIDAHVGATEDLEDAGAVAVGSYLESVKYEGKTLFDFFSKDKSHFETKSGIRELYPMVDALSAGQIAGLDFVSLMDLFQLALADKNTYKDVEEVSEDLDKTSIYENVDRDIYTKGGVALTNDALRAKARASEVEPEGYKPSTLTTVLWVSSACFAGATIVSSVVSKIMSGTVPTAVKNIPVAYKAIWNSLDDLNSSLSGLTDKINNLSLRWGGLGTDTLKDLASKIDARITELELAKDVKPANYSNSISSKLAVGFAVVTVLLTVFSTVMTILEAQDYYDTEYIPIPTYIVDEADITYENDKGEKVMNKNQTAYYKVVKCNRNAGESNITKKNYETMGDHNDIKGDIGREWLSLYTVKNSEGFPILADSLLYKKDYKEVPSGYETGIHEFGSASACDLNKKAYIFPDNPPSIKVFFKNEIPEGKKKPKSSDNTTGSIFSTSSLAIGVGSGIVFGGLFAALALRRRKIDVKED